MIRFTVDTDQEAFDAVAKHLASLKGQAVDADGKCLYQTPDGRRCAIGAILEAAPFQQYSIAMLVDGGKVDPGGLDAPLLQALQKVHDFELDWDGDRFVGWGLLREVASAFGLDDSVIDEMVTADLETP